MTGLLLCSLTAVPLLGFAGLGLSILFGRTPSERIVNRGIALVMFLHVLALAILGGHVLVEPRPIQWIAGDWFREPDRSFMVELFLDRASAMLLCASSLICIVVGFFSTRYLHRDQGYHRFFVLFLLFVAAVSLFYTAGSLELLLVGWELAGVTSVLLIAFFQFRAAPVRGSLYALLSYRLCDIALVTGIFLCHHWSSVHSITFDLSMLASLPPETLFGLRTAGLCLIIGSLAKSAQIPFVSWLPRAMEGPTPSSAVFYGAVSAHMGAFLLLRVSPLWRHVPALSALVIGIGASTAIYAAYAGRARSDAKTQLAFAAMAQLGLIFIEIGLDFERLAILHMVGHSFVRTLQFLKAPSLLHEFHRMGVTGKRLLKTSLFSVHELIPESARFRFFDVALREGLLPELIHRLVTACRKAVLGIDALEKSWADRIEQEKSC